MAIILSITDKTGVDHPQAFMTATVEVGRKETLISMRFWASFTAYKNNADLLFNNSPIQFRISNNGKLFKDNFSNIKVLPEGKTLLINLYDNILKHIDESITFYNDETYNTVEIQDINGVPTEIPVQKNTLDLKMQALYGIDFTQAIDSFTQEEFDLKINGLLNPSDAKRIFNETTEQFETYSSSQNNWLNG